MLWPWRNKIIMCLDFTVGFLAKRKAMQLNSVWEKTLKSDYISAQKSHSLKGTIYSILKSHAPHTFPPVTGKSINDSANSNLWGSRYTQHSMGWHTKGTMKQLLGVNSQKSVAQPFWFKWNSTCIQMNKGWNISQCTKSSQSICTICTLIYVLKFIHQVNC